MSFRALGSYTVVASFSRTVLEIASPLFTFSDSAFTERVLGAPAENYKGYVEADLTQRAKLVPSHSLYLLHGLADLTAPYTHGVAFAKALSEAGIIFRYQVRWNEKSERNEMILMPRVTMILESIRPRLFAILLCDRVTRTKITPWRVCSNTLIVPWRTFSPSASPWMPPSASSRRIFCCL